MVRGRPKLEKQEQQTQFVRTYEDDMCVETWLYDLSKSNGPVRVEIKYKNGIDKKWKKLIKSKLSNQ